MMESNPREEDVKDYYEDNAENFNFSFCEHEWVSDGKGFLVSRTVCPQCGQVWVLRLMKGRKIRLEEFLKNA